MFCFVHHKSILDVKIMRSQWDVSRLCSVSSGIRECSNDYNTQFKLITILCTPVFVTIWTLRTFFVDMTLVLSCLIVLLSTH